MSKLSDGRGNFFHLKDGVLHREDGPAIEWSNGESSWHLNGAKYTKEEFNQWLEKKQLNEKLQTTLVSLPTTKRSKI